MARRTIVVTGATGYVAQRMWAELNERFEVTGLDIRTTTAAGEEVPGVTACDLLAEDRSAYRGHFEGADTVVHCAWVSPAAGMEGAYEASEDSFRAEYANVRLAYNVYMAALEAGVRRVVVASSNHAADFYERLIWTERFDTVTPEMAPMSDNFYGWAKIAYEQLGFVFATGTIGDRALEMVQVRIGGPRDTADLEACEPGEIRKMHRGLGAYWSRCDQAQLFIKSIEAPDIANEHGVPFQIFYGVSGNSHNFWSIANARRVVGYAPQDNSQVVFAERIAELARDGDRDVPYSYSGG